MPYTINKTDGAVVATVADGTVDSSTSLKLIGKNYAGYGEIQNENFLFLLENFANTSAPGRAIAGQLWFDSGNGKLKFNDGAKWRTTGGAETGTVEPTGLTVGDFWWDTRNKQLYASNGDATFTLVGPQGVAGSGTTQMRSRSVRDTLGNAWPIIEAVVGTGTASEATVFIISPHETFTLAGTNSIPGFDSPRVIHKGITLAYTNGSTGVSDVGNDEFRFWGTASDSTKLGGYNYSDFLRTNNAIFTTPVQFADVGFTVGETPKLRVFNSGNTTPTIQNLLNDTIVFQTTVSGSTKTPLKLVGNDLLPGVSITSDIGSSGLTFKTVYAQSFEGTASQAKFLSLTPGGSVPSGYATASIPTAAGTIVVRTTTDETINGTNITAGAIKGTFFVGTATAANYADLAEKYLADAEYEVGTVVAVGGEKEVTACQKGARAIGAVSANPAYMMNAELEGGTYVALKGRVPVKVTGPITKGDRLIAGDDGTAVSATWNTFDTFGVALESSDDDGVKLVECLIL